MFADGIIDQILGGFCFSVTCVLIVIGIVINKIGSAMGSFFESDLGQEVTKEVTKGAIQRFFDNLFGD